MKLDSIKISRQWLWLLVMGVFVSSQGLATLFAQEEAAQGEAAPYKTMPIAEEYQDLSDEGIDRKDRTAWNKFQSAQKDRDDFRRNSMKAVSDLLYGKSTQVNSAEIARVMNGYIIPKMTQTDDASLSSLGEDRKEFFRAYVNKTGNPTLRNQLTNTVIPKMKEIVEGNYHPASRVNAMAIIGRWNDREGDRTAGQMPVPSRDLLTYMLDAVESDTLPVYLRVTALQGIERHVSVRNPRTSNVLTDSEARRINDLMLGFLGEVKPEGVNKDVAHWMKRRAIRIIGMVEKIGDNAVYANAIRQIYLNEKEPLFVRLEAASAFGALNFKDQTDLLDLKQVTIELAELVKLAAKKDIEFIDSKINDIRFTVKFLDGGDASATGGKDKAPSANVGQRADDAPPPGSDDKNKKDGDVVDILPFYHLDAVKRRYKHSAWSIRTALAGDGREPNGGLNRFTDAESPEELLILSIVKEIDKSMSGSNIKEAETEEEKEEAKKRKLSYADQLKLVLQNTSDALAELLPKPPAPVEKVATEDPAKPADDSTDNSKIGEDSGG